MSSDSDSYVKIDMILKFGTPDAVKVEVNDEIIWIPRSVMFGPEESEIPMNQLADEEKTIRVRQWFVRKNGLL